MNKKYGYLFKNIGILTISNFASKILVFLLVPLYTSVLSTEEYGSYDLVVTSMHFLLPILTLNIADAVMRFSMDKERDKGNVAVVGFRFVEIAVAIAGVLLALNRVFGLVKMISGMELVIFIYFLFYLLNSFLTQMAKGFERVMDMGIAGVIGTLVTVGANVLFLLVLKLGVNGFFYANILGCAAPALFYFFRLKCWNYVTGRVEKKLKTEMLAYCVPLILVALCWNVNSSLDKYMVTGFCGVAANGLLAIAYKIPNILSIIQNIFTQAWQISAVAEHESKDVKKFYSSTFEYSSAFICLCCSALIILSRPLASFLYAKDFYDAWQYVPFLLISAAFNMAGGFVGPLLSAQMNSKAMAKSAIYGVAVNVVFNTLLIWLIGIQGATIATAMSSFVIFLVRKLAVRDMIDKSFNKSLYGSWILMVLLGCAEIWLQNYLVEAGLFVVICIVYWRQIKGIAQVGVKIIKR